MLLNNRNFSLVFLGGMWKQKNLTPRKEIKKERNEDYRGI